jgi:hypothetical protein
MEIKVNPREIKVHPAPSVLLLKIAVFHRGYIKPTLICSDRWLDGPSPKASLAQSTITLPRVASYSGKKMVFQSCFMSTTSQPRLGASLRASTSWPVLFVSAS